MPARLPAPFRASLGALIVLASMEGSHAQSAVAPAATDSRIVQVKVYPGSATVERVAHVSAGRRTLTFACLPAGLDVQSLQVSADASVRIGETSVLTEQRALSARCSGNALDGRIRELEDQKDAIQAQADALGLVTGYLKGVSGATEEAPGKHAAASPSAPDCKAMAAT